MGQHISVLAQGIYFYSICPPRCAAHRPGSLSRVVMAASWLCTGLCRQVPKAGKAALCHPHACPLRAAAPSVAAVASVVP